MSFNYRVPLLTEALNWERTIYPTPSARVLFKASLGGKACHWDAWCSETGRTPKKTLQNVQRWHAWTSGPHQRALWPEQTSEQQRSALIRTHCPAPHALWELYSTGGACHTAVLLSCYSLWYCNVILISVRWHLYSKCSCLDTDTDKWTAFKTQILFEYVQF